MDGCKGRITIGFVVKKDSCSAKGRKMKNVIPYPKVNGGHNIKIKYINVGENKLFS